MRLHCTYAGGGGGGEQGMLMYITGRMQPIRAYRGGVRKKRVCLTSPRPIPDQTTVLGSAQLPSRRSGADGPACA